MKTLFLNLGSDNVWLAFGETARISQLRIKENTVDFGDENDRSCTDNLRFSFFLWRKPCADLAWPAHLTCLKSMYPCPLLGCRVHSVQSVLVKLGIYNLFFGPTLWLKMYVFLNDLFITYLILNKLQGDICWSLSLVLSWSWKNHDKLLMTFWEKVKWSKIILIVLLLLHANSSF